MCIFCYDVITGLVLQARMSYQSWMEVGEQLIVEEQQVAAKAAAKKAKKLRQKATKQALQATENSLAQHSPEPSPATTAVALDNLHHRDAPTAQALQATHIVVLMINHFVLVAK